MVTFKQLTIKFDALQPRERIILAVAVAGVLYFLVNLLLLTPEQNKQKLLQQQIATQQKELSTFYDTNKEISNQLTNDPLAKARITRDNLSKSIADVDALLGQANATSSQVGELIKSILIASPGLSLVSLKTLPVSTFYTAKVASTAPITAASTSPVNLTPVNTASANHEIKAAPAAIAPQIPLTIYKHGIEVSIKGNYLAMVPYLQNLQNNSKRLFWNDAKLDVTVYPEAILKITIFTMSEQPSSILG